MRTFEAVLEKITVERMTVRIQANGLAQALSRAEQSTQFAKVKGVTVVKPYDVGHVSDTERVLAVREVR